MRGIGSFLSIPSRLKLEPNGLEFWRLLLANGCAMYPLDIYRFRLRRYKSLGSNVLLDSELRSFFLLLLARAFLSRSSRASLSDRYVSLLLVGINIIGILSSETGVRSNFGAGGLGTFNKSRRGIDSFRERY
jgi:hypothetical protein